MSLKIADNRYKKILQDRIDVKNKESGNLMELMHKDQDAEESYQLDLIEVEAKGPFATYEKEFHTGVVDYDYKKLLRKHNVSSNLLSNKPKTPHSKDNNDPQNQDTE